MEIDQVKDYLLNNVDKIQEILENIGCHNIKIIKNKRIQSALPEGDNNSSIQIRLNEYLDAKIYTRNEFESYAVKDIFSVIQYIKDYTLHEAIDLVCKICNIQYNSSRNVNRSPSYSFLKQYVRSVKKEDTIIEEDILPESFTKRFVREDCLQYYVDGVNSETQKKFNVCYDVLENRVVFPIRNDSGQLLSFKGRTCCKDYKKDNIPKFLSYYPSNNNCYLFGLYENREAIKLSNEIYVCEAEKGNMELDSMQINNSVSINKKTISEIQLKKLFKLGKSVILLLDNDVTLEEIYIECRKFKKLLNVSYVRDTLHLLGLKDSPMDCGIEIFNKLITNCKFEYKGE